MTNRVAHIVLLTYFYQPVKQIYYKPKPPYINYLLVSTENDLVRLGKMSALTQINDGWRQIVR